MLTRHLVIRVLVGIRQKPLKTSLVMVSIPRYGAGSAEDDRNFIEIIIFTFGKYILLFEMC